VTAHVLGQLAGARVAARAVLLERAHRDPVEVAAMSFVSACTSSRRWRAISTEPCVLMRTDGRGGSSSRMMRCSSP
jgi:hypothetical protein